MLLDCQSKKKYGCEWPLDYSDIDIELSCYREGRTPDKGGLGKYGHARECIELLWNRPDDTISPFFWTPWTERMIKAMCENKVVALSGASSSGKSCCMAVICILDYLSAPFDALCLITSTTLNAAALRIFKDVVRFWRPEFPGKYSGHRKRILGMNRNCKDSSNQYIETCGIQVIACGGKKNVASAFAGMKSPHLSVFYDELAELPIDLVSIWEGNLKGNPGATLRAAANPSSRFDAFGKLCKPIHGWKSVDLESEHEWDIQGGKFLRFDARDNPRITEGRDDWNFYWSKDQVYSYIEEEGENSLNVLKYIKATFSLSMEEDTFITEQDITSKGGDTSPIWGSGDLIRVAAIDPGFTNGGDRTAITIGCIGREIDDRYILGIEKTIVIKDSSSISKTNEDKSRTRNHIVCDKIADILEKHDIKPENVAVDETGATAFAEILAHKIGPKFNGFKFSGKASIKPLSFRDKTPASSICHLRVSEIWYRLKLAFLDGRIKGLGDDVINEIISRKLLHIAGKIAIEDKKSYKKRLRISPDLADTIVILYNFCLEKFPDKIGIKSTYRQNSKTSSEMLLDAIPSIRYDRKRKVILYRGPDIHTQEKHPRNNWISTMKHLNELNSTNNY